MIQVNGFLCHHVATKTEGNCGEITCRHATFSDATFSDATFSDATFSEVRCFRINPRNSCYFVVFCHSFALSAGLGLPPRGCCHRWSRASRIGSRASCKASRLLPEDAGQPLHEGMLEGSPRLQEEVPQGGTARMRKEAMSQAVLRMRQELSQNHDGARRMNWSQQQ